MSSELACPVPVSGYTHIVMAHGGGGRLSEALLERIFLPAFDNPMLNAREDQAALPALGPGRVLVTTDAFVVQPLFFPGGNIGSLSVHGTLNDLAMGGAVPKFLTAAFILEEGLPLQTLQSIVQSMAEACRVDQVTIVAGDTKVVEKGKGDGVFITTTGVGVVTAPVLSAAACRPGDRVIVSGTVGDHGMAIMSLREGLRFGTELQSDSASLCGLVQTLLAEGEGLRCMRDPTRGGLASTLNELAKSSHVGMAIDEGAVPVRAEVSGACEMLGLDPFYVANEGKLVAIVDAVHADRLLRRMQSHALGKNAAIIGEVTADSTGTVSVRTRIGGERVLPMLSGEQLPRIC